MAFTRAQLDHMSCRDPDCPAPLEHPLTLNAACHPGEGLLAVYDRQTGELHLRCRICQRPMCAVEVAAGSPN